MLPPCSHAFLMAIVLGLVTGFAQADDCPRCLHGDFHEFWPCNCGTCTIPWASCDGQCCPGSSCGSVCGIGGKKDGKPTWACVFTQMKPCCSFCQQTDTCHATYQPAGDVRWHIGNGDFYPGSGTACPTYGKARNATMPLSLSSGQSGVAWFTSAYLPTFSNEGRLLRGNHKHLDLGRPGRCAANLDVRMRGNVLDQNLTIRSVGQCCDLCADTPECTAWNMESHNCTLFDSPLEDIHESLTDLDYGIPVFSGLKVIPFSEQGKTTPSSPSFVL